MNIHEWQELTGLDAKEFYNKNGVTKDTFKNAVKRGYSTLRRGCPAGHPLRTMYLSMINRCYNKNNKDYHLYGGRGIRVSGEFFYSFQKYAEHIGERQGKHLSIDRIDNNGNYERGNLRWADWTEQAVNKRVGVENANGHHGLVSETKYYGRFSRYHRQFSTHKYLNKDNAIASLEILKYRIDNGMYA